MTLFDKKKKSKEGSPQLLKIINKLDSVTVDEPELLEEIKLDIQEGIPLNDKKLDYLRKMINEFKEKNKDDVRINISHDTNIDKEKPKAKNNKKFGTLFNRKKSKNEKNISMETSKTNDVVDDSNCEPTSKKKFGNPFKKTNSVNSSKSKSDKQKSKFFKMFSKKPKKQELVSDSVVHANDSTPINTESSIQDNDDSSNSSLIENKQQVKQSTVLEIPKKIDDETEDSLPAFEKDDVEKQFFESKDSSDEFQEKQELELKEIKEIIDEIEAEKSVLYDDVNKVKSNHNYKKFILRFDELQTNLDTASSGLYSIQSTVYKRLKEIRKLKTDLINLKDEIEDLDFTSKKSIR